ncbi:MAG: hypothetical protein KJ593_05225 [Candidatus Omnitrophica bacterium]|nr:hypothetical protein [Candidatus Omnitrophota bacterium]
MRVRLRVWKHFDINEVKEHLVIVGQLSADCANCRAIGIDYLKAKKCPECNSEFKFIATRQNQGRFPPHLIKRIGQMRPELELIDYADFKHASDRSQAENFFKK